MFESMNIFDFYLAELILTFFSKPLCKFSDIHSFVTQSVPLHCFTATIYMMNHMMYICALRGVN